MVGRHRTKAEEWTRAHRLSVTSVLMAVFSIMVTISGVKIWNGQSTTNNFDVACLQFCGGQTISNASPNPPLPPNKNVGCSADGSDTKSSGWGPARNLLSRDQLSDFPSFNLDNFPEIIGDERHPYSVREDTPPPNNWKFNIQAERGKTYVLRLYIHNSAGDHSPDLVAQGARVSVSLPVCTGRRVATNGFIDSTNAIPSQVYGGVSFISNQPFNLAYVKGSAMICTNHFVCNADGTGGAPISEDFLTNKGALVGYDALDGEIRGGYQYSVYFIYKVKAQFAGD